VGREGGIEEALEVKLLLGMVRRGRRTKKLEL
jgi:hypothetical protein